jgi:hypothetical protein
MVIFDVIALRGAFLNVVPIVIFILMPRRPLVRISTFETMVLPKRTPKYCCPLINVFQAVLVKASIALVLKFVPEKDETKTFVSSIGTSVSTPEARW